jgi:murein DD-endopeptidase MepM/ murein hydrolase activator NlpD
VPSHRPARGRHRLPAPPPPPATGRHRTKGASRSRYTAVATTALLGAGVVALATGSALPTHGVAAADAAARFDPALGRADVSDQIRHLQLAVRPATVAASRPTATRRATAARASRATARTRRATVRIAPPRWVRPGTGHLSSCFCARWGVMHEGIDLAAPWGSPIYAAGAGRVMRAGPSNGFGNLIVIRHADGSETWYGHEEAILVSVGQQVRAGQRIARVGSLGESTGPHLHFQVMIDGHAVDPIPWLAARGVHV